MLKINKVYLIFLIYCVLCQFHDTVNAVIDPNENSLAIQILNDCFGIDPSIIIDPCNTNNGISCNADGNVNKIFLHSGGQYCELGDLSAFKKLQSIYIEGNQTLDTQFYNHFQSNTFLETISIYNQSKPMSTTAILPLSLSSIKIGYSTFPLGKNFFEGYSLSSLTIEKSGQSFSLPESLDTFNFNLEVVILPINQYSIPPSNMGLYLVKLSTLTLNVENEMSVSNYQQYQFPTFSRFASLVILRINFQNKQTPATAQLFEFPSSFSSSISISYLEISGIGFKLNETLGYLDFSGYIHPLNLKIERTCDMIKPCNNTDCIRMPLSSSLVISYCEFSFDIINLNNLSVFQTKYNSYQQKLPTIANPTSYEKFQIENSNVYGNIPDSYCSFPLSVLVLYDCNLNGTVPSCYLCQGGTDYNLNSNSILPNPYSNFNKSSPPYCRFFETYDTDRNYFDTNGGLFIITGNELGWALFPQTNKFIIPNSKFSIPIPRGTGKGITVQVLFLINSYKKTFTYSYIPPLIVSYEVFTDSGNEFFRIIGKCFDYGNNNTVLVNGNSINFSAADSNKNGSIYNADTNFVSQLNISEKYQFSINVGGQDSNVIDFYFFKTVSVSDSNIKFNVHGGSITLNGVFGTTNSSLVNVLVDFNNNCIVTYVNTTTLSINYPPLEAGHYPLLISVGGNQISIQIEYIEGEFPTSSITSSTTSSTTTSTTTSTSSPTITGGESSLDDKPSTSSKCEISFYSIILLILLLSL